MALTASHGDSNPTAQASTQKWPWRRLKHTRPTSVPSPATTGSRSVCFGVEQLDRAIDRLAGSHAPLLARRELAEP